MSGIEYVVEEKTGCLIELNPSENDVDGSSEAFEYLDEYYDKDSSGTSMSFVQAEETSEETSEEQENDSYSTLEFDARNFPDRQGIFSLYAYKGDLKNGLRANTNICLWRRDGQFLIQKYLHDKDTNGNAINFNSSMVYSLWEDRRQDEFLEVKVKCVANSGKDATRSSKVELIDVNGIEQSCIEGKFHELDLETYVSYADKKKKEAASNGMILAASTVESFQEHTKMETDYIDEV